jgi:hypothetical protein
VRYSRLATGARYLLGAVRIVNGAATLFVPVDFARRQGVDPGANPAAIYVLRMFGVRTLVIGAQLLLLEDEELEAVVRTAPLIHATDVVAAAMGGLSGQLPRSTAKKAVLISSVNTLLALLSNTGRKPKRKRRRRKHD